MAGKLEIIQGEVQPYTIRLKNAQTGDPLDLTSATKLDVCFKVGSVEVKKVLADHTIASPFTIGKFTGELDATDTASLGEAREVTLEITVNSPGAAGTSGKDRKIHILEAFDVKAKICT